jgi:hypothetical protein
MQFALAMPSMQYPKIVAVCMHSGLDSKTCAAAAMHAHVCDGKCVPVALVKRVRQCHCKCFIDSGNVVCHAQFQPTIMCTQPIAAFSTLCSTTHYLLVTIVCPLS